MHKLLWFFFCFFFFVVSFSFAEDGLNVIKSKNGFLFVFNDDSESFMIEFRGKKFIDVEPEDLVFSIDGQLFQFTVVPINVFLNEKSDLDTLLQHFEFELNYISKNFNIDLKNLKPKFHKNKGTNKVLFWELSYDVGSTLTDEETVVKQIFASTATNKFVLLVASPLTRKNDYKQSKKRIIDALYNLRYKEGKFDLESLRDSLKIK